MPLHPPKTVPEDGLGRFEELHGSGTLSFGANEAVREIPVRLLRPSQPVNVLQIHGTADEVVPYGGGALLAGLPVVAQFPAALATVQAWAVFNGCQGPISDAQPSMDMDLGVPSLDTIAMHYTNCPPGGAVELWTINGGKHEPTLFSGTRSSEYSACVIDWLLAHPKP